MYDPLKREPKFSNADSTPLFELSVLSNHYHPTVKLWAEKLLRGELIEYAGDPLLDFGIANFLDRISYKNPKSAEKLAKMKGKLRMADSEQPVNTYDFKSAILINQREEEQFLYKFFKEKAPKKQKKGEFEDEEEDMELDKFADEVIEKEMKKMN